MTVQTRAPQPGALHASDLRLEAVGLSRRFGALVAVDRLSFEMVGPGVIGLLGPNGAGKTTVIRMCTTALVPSAGRASVGGFDVMSEPLRARAALGYLPESISLLTEARVWEALAFTAGLRGLRGAVLRSEVDGCLERVGLGGKGNRIIKTLSHGQRRRVGLASALIGDPPILVLDEPTIGLDPAQLLSIRSLIRDLGRDHLVVLSSHILSEVEALCDQVLVIKKGRRVAYGPPRTLAADLGVPPTVRVTAGGIGPEDLAEVVRHALGPELEMTVTDSGGLSQAMTQVDPSAVPALARRLAERGVEVHELRVDYPTLEELFVRLVGTSSDGQGDAR